MKKLWLLYTILAALSWALWGTLTKYVSGNMTPYSYQLLFTTGMLFSLPFFINKCKKEEVNSKGIILGIFTSTFAIIGNISVYQSFVLGGQASVVLPLTNLYPLITIVIALLIFKERLYLVNLVGIMIVVPAIMLLSGQSEIFYSPVYFFRSMGLKAWILFAFLSLLLFGLFNASQKVVTNYLSAGWSYISFITASILVSVCFMAFGLVDFDFSPKTFGIGSMAGMFDGLGVLAIYAAYRAKGKASQVSSIATSLQQVFTICLAIIFLKETLTTPEYIGIALAILGSWFISLEKKKKEK